MDDESRIVRPGLAATGARAVYRPRSATDDHPWEVDSRWYDLHNGERYSDEQVCTSEEYAKLRRQAKPRK